MPKETNDFMPSKNDKFLRTTMICDGVPRTSLSRVYDKSSVDVVDVYGNSPAQILNDIKISYRKRMQDFAQLKHCHFCESNNVMAVFSARGTLLRIVSDFSIDRVYELNELLQNPSLLPGDGSDFGKRAENFMEWEKEFWI